MAPGWTTLMFLLGAKMERFPGDSTLEQSTMKRLWESTEKSCQ